MFTNRFISLLIAISLLAVVVLVVREANATTTLVSATRSYSAWAKAAEAEAITVNSATHSYTVWAKAAEAGSSTVDSATRSYIAQAKAAACGVDATYGPNLDSATRSYTAWGAALQAKNNLCH